MSSLVCKNIRIDGRRTSIKLEASMWHALADISARTERRLDEIFSEVAGRKAPGTFTSAMRGYILEYYRTAERQARERAERASATRARDLEARAWSDLAS